MNILRFLRFWFPVIVYSGIIFYVSSIPRVVTPLGIANIDKIFHVVEYLPFGFLLARALNNVSFTLSSKRIIIITVILTLFYGISDEIHQLYVDGRESKVADVIADVIGGAIGAWVYLRLTKQ